MAKEFADLSPKAQSAIVDAVLEIDVVDLPEDVKQEIAEWATLPWLDCPTCQNEKCKLPAVVTVGHPNKLLFCSACGTSFQGTDEQFMQASKADAAWVEKCDAEVR